MADTCPGPSMNSDVWFEFQQPCWGLMTIRTCNDAGYDSMIAAYHFNEWCADVGPITDNSNLLECNDDFCPGGGTAAGVSGEVFGCVKIAVGGFAQNNDDASAARADDEAA